MSIKKLYNNILSSNLNLKADTLEYKKVRIINFILYLSVLINLLLIPDNINKGMVIYPIASAFVVIVGTIGIILLRKNLKNLNIVSHLSISVIYLILLPALFEGGIANSGFVWFALLPLFSIFLLQTQTGIKWVYFLLSTIFIFFLFADFIQIPYQKEYLIFLSISLVVETLFVKLLSDIQDAFVVTLRGKNRMLSDLAEHQDDEIDRRSVILIRQEQHITQKSKMESLGEMIANISHQWKQPLNRINVIAADVELSKVLEDDSVDPYEAIKDILKQTNLMQETMNDFLKFSSPNAKDKEFFIDNSITMMLSLIESSFYKENIELKYINNYKNAKIVGKNAEFIHAIMNIANNAKDALVINNIENPYLHINLEEKNNKIILTFKDNAGGIPEKIIDKIFEAYFTTKEKNGGTGLGLDLTYKVITENLNGKVHVKNENDGAIFTITLG